MYIIDIIINKILAHADSRRHTVFARFMLSLLPASVRTPITLSDTELANLSSAQAVVRAARLRVLGKQSFHELDDGREDMVSIGIFAYNRLDLLKKTCSTLSSYLNEYGGNFKHEVLFFHDGPNAEIEAWARANPLFDKVFINEQNRRLHYTINRFWFEESKGKYLLNLEDDWMCEYQDDFIGNAIDVLKHDERVGSVRLERKYPGDYRKWNEAFKIRWRVLSSRIFVTPTLKFSYRLLERQKSGQGVYGNSCGLIRYSAVCLAGRIRTGTERRLTQEPDYTKQFNSMWAGARGIYQKDSPFLHIGYSRSVSDRNLYIQQRS